MAIMGRRRTHKRPVPVPPKPTRPSGKGPVPAPPKPYPPSGRRPPVPAPPRPAEPSGRRPPVPAPPRPAAPSGRRPVPAPPKPTRPSGRGMSGTQARSMLMAYAHKNFPGAQIRPAPPGTAAGDSGGCILVDHKSGNTYLCCLDEDDEIVCRIVTLEIPDDDDASRPRPTPNYIRGTKRRRRWNRGHIGS
jgi:hypothetical protein